MIKEILIFVSGSSILIGAISWLFKTLLKQLLDKDIEKYKHELKEVLIKREITYKNLQEKRIEIIAQIYSLLVESIYSVEKYCSPIGNLDNKTGEIYKDAIRVLVNFFKYFDKNRIYLSEELCLIIDTAIKELRNATEDIYSNAQIAKITNDNLEATKVWMDHWTNFKNKQNPSVRTELENEIRKLIGVIES